VNHCKECAVGKSTRQPFDNKVIPETEPPECIHVDLWGKAQTISLEGASYMMVIADGRSDMKFPFFLSNKRLETIVQNMAQFCHEAEVQTSQKIKIVWVNLGGEFDSEIFISWCHSYGIKVE
jgi:hypothetical protein